MALIFYMSAQPQLESEATSNLATELIYRILNVLFPSGLISIEEFFARYGQFIRKLAHFSEFMILGILIKLNYMEDRNADTIWIPFLFAALYAMSDEFHQIFVQGRYCSIKDMLIDSSGALTGILLCHLILKGWKKERSH